MTEFKSPIEEKFFQAAKEKIPGLIPQMPVTACGRSYRLDFAKVIRDENDGKGVLKVAIELDGYEYHSSIEQRNHDVQRERDLMQEGWQIIRFTGSHINDDVNKCVDEAALLINKWSNDRGVDSGLKSPSGTLIPPGKEDRKRRSGFNRPGSKAILASAAAIFVLAAILLTSGGIIQSFVPGPGNLGDIPSLESLSPSPAGPQAPGSKVVWIAHVKDGAKGDLVYRFWLKGPATDGSWRDATGWIKENKWTWTTTSYDQGINQVKAEVRAVISPENESSFKVQDYSLVKANMPPAITELKADSYSPQDAGSSVTWMVRASDPENDTLRYRFLLKGPDTGEIWRDVTGWTEEYSWKWETTSSDVGDNQVKVEVKDGKHGDKEDSSRIENFSISSTNRPPAIYDLTPDPKSPQEIGSRINWKANASDKDGDGIYYRFMLKGPSTDGEWKDETGWTKSSIWPWDTTSMDAGNYQVKAQVNDEGDGDEEDSTIAAYSLTGKAAPEETSQVKEETKKEPEEESSAESTEANVAEEPVNNPVDVKEQAAEGDLAKVQTQAEESTAPAEEKEVKSEENVAPAPQESEPKQESQPAQSIEASPEKAAPQASADQPKDLDQDTVSAAREEAPKEEASTGRNPDQAEESHRDTDPDSNTEDKSESQVHQDDGTLYLGGDTGERILARIAPAGTAPSGSE